jgi:hypothetical protein
MATNKNINTQSNSHEKVIDKSTNNNNIPEKNKGGQPSKKNKFPKERQQVLDELFTILGVTSNNMTFNLSNIENDKNKQQEILDLVDDIKKYFNYGSWTYFCRPNIKKPYIGLTKSLLKEMGYKMDSSYVIDGKSKKISQKNMIITKKT